MKILEGLTPLMARIEAGLDKVQRWTNFQQSSGSRAQTTLAHTASIQFVAIAVIEAERTHNPEPFDAAFVHQALALHDLGEVAFAADGHDVLYDNKNDQSDQRELQAVSDMIRSFPDWLREVWLTRYLAQYASKPGGFDAETQVCLTALAKDRRLECRLFAAVENLDYLLYAYHEYRRAGNLRILVHTLHRSHTKLKALAAELPGFGHLYTEEIIAWAEGILMENEGLEEASIVDGYRNIPSSEEYLRNPSSLR